MKAEAIRWWMEMLRKNVYAQIGVAAFGALFAGFGMMLRNIIPVPGFSFLLGLATMFGGIVSCFLSGTLYDYLNKRLVIVESEEKKEKKKEDKHARKQKANKTDRS